MKKLLILIVAIVALQTVSAQGPVYNFNFYNNGSEVPSDGQNPAVNINQAPPVAAGPVVKEIVKERKEKGESIFGFEIGYGVTQSVGHVDDAFYPIGEQTIGTAGGSVNLLIKIGKNIKMKLGYITERFTIDRVSNRSDESWDYYSFDNDYLAPTSYSHTVSLTGINLGISGSAHVVGPFALTAEVEGQYSFGKDATDYGSTEYVKTYVGISVGPQLSIGKYYLNVLGKVGYQDFRQDGNSIDSAVIYGAQANFGFMI